MKENIMAMVITTANFTAMDAQRKINRDLGDSRFGRSTMMRLIAIAAELQVSNYMINGA